MRDWRNGLFILSLTVFLFGDGLWADELLFQLSGDDQAKPSFAAGSAEPLEQKDVLPVEGRHGKALRFGQGSLLRFAAKGNLNRQCGTVCLWVRPNWDAEEQSNHAFFVDDRQFKTGNNSLTLWEWHTGQLRFDVRDEKDNYLTGSVKAWKKGEWRHVAAAWDCRVGSWLFLDGDMVASKKFTWTPQEGEFFQFGADRGGGWASDADLGDIRIYDCPLTTDQVRRAMTGRPIPRVSYLGVTLPETIAVGQPFEAELRYERTEAIGDGCEVALLMDDTQIASAPLPADAMPGKEERAVLRAAIPPYLYPAPGKRTFAVKIAGAFEANGDKARREAMVRPTEPRPRGVGFQAEQIAALPDDGGLFLLGEFIPKQDALRRREELARDTRWADAVACRLVDQVDCAQTDHGYWENSPAAVQELAPGIKFRCVGPQEAVTQKQKHRKREVPALAAFSYRLKVTPRPTPHLIVVESINDAERYLEVAIEHPLDSKPAPHLASCGVGDRTAIHLSVTYSGREYPTDGKPFRQALMLFPKTDAVEVMISGTKRAHFPDASPAAVSRIWVYEVIEPFADIQNVIPLPEGTAARSVSIFFPEIRLLFDKYGFPSAGAAMRASTLRLFLDYMKFMGLNRFELRPFPLSSKAYFKSNRFEQASDLDFFAEALPLMQEAGIAVVPRVMYLHSYHKLLEGDEDNFQRAVSGNILKFGQEGPLPDPLRPQTQKVVMDSLQAMLDACEGYGNVPEIGFDTSIGGLYGWEFPTPSSTAGYGRWDVEQFAKDEGVKLPDGLDTPAKCHDWLKANAWEKWIAWRCARWHAFCAQMRDLAASKGKKLELSVRIMPREEFSKDGTPILDIYRCTGYDPALFRDESNICMDYFIRINSDRYFGRPWWKPWFYEPCQTGMFVSKEARHVEMYFNYWEIPFHPWGFRVGPGSPVGRNFFEPLTYAMRTMNPQDVTLFNWFAATIGREFEVREFCRAFRALSAVEPRDFDGVIEPKPTDDRLWVKWFGDRLAVVNDAPVARSITLTIPLPAPKAAAIFDAALAQRLDSTVHDGKLTVPLALRPFDLRTLILEPEKK
ncbi:MAG: LamG domain-containing protein [Planctomycetota bacterium]